MHQNPEPLFAHDEPGPEFETFPLARLVQRPGLAAEKAARRIRHYAQEGWISPRAYRGTGPTAAQIWKPADAAAVLALNALNEAGVADRDVMGHASVALWGWQPEQSARSRQGTHPITRALWGTPRGEFWIFHVRILRDDQSGQRMVRAYVYQDSEPPEFSPDARSPFLPETSITVNLAPLLLPIAQRINSGATPNGH